MTHETQSIGLGVATGGNTPAPTESVTDPTSTVAATNNVASDPTSPTVLDDLGDRPMLATTAVSPVSNISTGTAHKCNSVTRRAIVEAEAKISDLTDAYMGDTISHETYLKRVRPLQRKRDECRISLGRTKTDSMTATDTGLTPKNSGQQSENPSSEIKSPVEHEIVAELPTLQPD